MLINADIFSVFCYVTGDSVTLGLKMLVIIRSVVQSLSALFLSL